jgi:carboxyl-terminal processing protease
MKMKWGAAIAATVALVFVIIVGCKTPRTAAAAAPPADPPTNAATQSFKPLTPGPDDARIAYWTAAFLQERQYSRRPFDTSISTNFFDNYLETLDPRREFFLQSDMDEFSHYRTNLDVFTLGGRGRANVTPAYEIFNRFLERLAQRTAYANSLLQQDHFKFDTDERFPLDRRHASYPQDLAAAQTLWSQEVRNDFLQARLVREFSSTNGGAFLSLPKNADADITADLAKHYNWILHTATNYESDNVRQFYLNALAHAYDPHSDYLNQERKQNFKIEMSLSLGGIGAQLKDDFGYCTIDALVPGGPAEKNGKIKPKERIVAVAQSNQPPVNVVDMDLSKVVELIRGPKGTQVRLTLENKDNPTSSRHVETLTRDEIKLADQEATAKLIELANGHGGTGRIGVIKVPSFYAPLDSGAHSRISADVATLISKLKAEKVGGIILDMRYNPGGSLEEAIQFTGLFIRSGPVVLARNWDGQVETNAVINSGALYAGPLVVLVNRFSASAAEIAAAALQDYGRAVIVGDTSTHGKGTVQSLVPLENLIGLAAINATNDPGELKVTIRAFYRITGASTQLKGVEPDIVLPDIWNNNPDIGEGALENALRLEPIDGAPFTKYNLVQPYLADLRRLSAERVTTNQDFAYVTQDIAQDQKSRADKTSTMNEQEAIRQHQTENAQDLARKAELAVRPLPDERIYNLTVENSATNGLPAPAPLAVTNQNARLTFTNKNGSVSMMTTNNDFAVGVVLNQFVTNTPAGRVHLGTVVTQPRPDWMLDETVNILQDYISLLSKSPGLIANQ